MTETAEEFDGGTISLDKGGGRSVSHDFKVDIAIPNGYNYVLVTTAGRDREAAC